MELTEKEDLAQQGCKFEMNNKKMLNLGLKIFVFCYNIIVERFNATLCLYKMHKIITQSCEN